MYSKRNVLKALAFLVDGYIDFREGILIKNTEIPINFVKGISYMKVLALKEKKNFPNNMNEFIKLTTIPIGDWGYDFLNNAIEDLDIKHCCLYQPNQIDDFDEYSYYEYEDDEDEEIDVLYQAKEIKNALFTGADIEEFYNDQIFYELFKHLEEEEYQICRDGINNTLLKLTNFPSVGYFKGLSFEVINILKSKVYTKVDKYTQVHNHPDYKNGVVIKCPVCGALMEKYGRYHLKCPIPKCNFKKEKLRISIHAYNKENMVAYNENLMVLKKNFHNSIKFPGIAELELLDALTEFNKTYNTISKIVKYPKKDSADFLIYFTNGDIHIIDVKDYKVAKDLAKHLNSSSSNDITKKKHGLTYTKAFIIAPDYLDKVYNYRSDFESEIKNKKLNFHFVSSYIKELESLNTQQQMSLF